MRFLTQDDFKAVCDAQTLNVIDQADTDNLNRAENYAIEEISSYLRSRYDTAVAFAATGSDRNNHLVMIVADVALYHLIAWLPKRIGFEIRETRYNQALSWLRDVQAGRATPDLPVPTDTAGNPTAQPVRYGGWRKSGYQY